MKSEYIVIILNNINVNPEYIDIGQNIYLKILNVFRAWILIFVDIAQNFTHSHKVHVYNVPLEKRKRTEHQSIE